MPKFLVLLLALSLIPLACGTADGDDDNGDWNIDEENGATSAPASCPDSSQGYDYLSEDPDFCATVDVSCPDEAEIPFLDEDCGCGCVDAGQPPQSIDECPSEEDGYDYISEEPLECAAMVIGCPAGQEVFFDDECGCGCVDSEPAGKCAPVDATGAGDVCPGEPLYGFDGSECVNIVADSCVCEGPGCGELTNFIEECEEEYAPCIDGTCEPMDAVGDGMCDEFHGWAYIGGETADEACVGISGCECVGDDCPELIDEYDDCTQRHQLCSE